MSIERDLLHRWYRGARDQVDFGELYDKTEELLAQPEQTKQEPDYYLWHDECHEQHPTNDGDPDVYPLYIAPPKQEPLSVERIADLWTDINTNSVRNFARAIEKAHGIGVDDE